MKREEYAVRICAIALLLLMPSMYAQPKKEPKPKSVTVTGCIVTGVECLTLKNSKGKQDYSVPKSDKLKVGQAYTITGTVTDIGFCQEGKPILAPSQRSWTRSWKM